MLKSLISLAPPNIISVLVQSTSMAGGGLRTWNSAWKREPWFWGCSDTWRCLPDSEPHPGRRPSPQGPGVRKKSTSLECFRSHKNWAENSCSFNFLRLSVSVFLIQSLNCVSCVLHIYGTKAFPWGNVIELVHLKLPSWRWAPQDPSGGHQDRAYLLDLRLGIRQHLEHQGDLNTPAQLRPIDWIVGWRRSLSTGLKRLVRMAKMLNRFWFSKESQWEHQACRKTRPLHDITSNLQI